MHIRNNFTTKGIVCMYATDSIQAVFNMLSIYGRFQIIGSAKIQAMKYSSDYDLQEYVKEPNATTLLHIFQAKFRKALANTNIFIIDFKCGKTKDGEPIRWNKHTIAKGKQRLENDRWITFQECLYMKSTIKMDIIGLISGAFCEFSENYYITLGSFSTFDRKTTHSIHRDLLLDARYYYEEGDAFKALKRLFSYFYSKEIRKPLQSKLISFFNSEVGLMNKCKHDLALLQMVQENTFRKPNPKDIAHHLQLIQRHVDSVLPHAPKGMEKLREFLHTFVYRSTHAFLGKNIILSHYIS